MQFNRARTYQKIKKSFGLNIFLQLITCDILPYICFLASATRLQQWEFPPIVATTTGKQGVRHCLSIFIKKQKTYPFTQSSVAKKVARNTPIFFIYEMQIYRATTYQKIKNFFGLRFFLQFITCDKLLCIFVRFGKKREDF